MEYILVLTFLVFLQLTGHAQSGQTTNHCFYFDTHPSDGTPTKITITVYYTDGTSQVFNPSYTYYDNCYTSYSNCDDNCIQQYCQTHVDDDDCYSNAQISCCTSSTYCYRHFKGYISTIKEPRTVYFEFWGSGGHYKERYEMSENWPNVGRLYTAHCESTCGGVDFIWFNPFTISKGTEDKLNQKLNIIENDYKAVGYMTSDDYYYKLSSSSTWQQTNFFYPDFTPTAMPDYPNILDKSVDIQLRQHGVPSGEFRSNFISHTFYGKPRISVDNGGLVCQDVSIPIHCFYELDPVQEKLNIGARLEYSVDNGTTYADIKDVNTVLANATTNIYFSNITNDASYLGRAIRLRPYKVYGGVRFTSSYFNEVTFLPIPNMTITGTAPKCAETNDGGFQIDMSNIPYSGNVNFFITIDRILNGTSDDFRTLNKTYNIIANQTNTINITNLDMPDQNFKLESGNYTVTVRINRSEGSCPKIVPNCIISAAPLLFQCNAEAVFQPGSTTYHVKTGQNSGQVKFTFTGGTEPFTIKEGSTILKTVYNTDLDANGNYLMNVTTTMGAGTTSELHTYSLADKETCQGKKSVPITFYRPNDISIANGTPLNIDCNLNDAGSHTNGQVNWSITGGVYPYSVQLYRHGTPTDAAVGAPIAIYDSNAGFNGALITTGIYYIKVSDALYTNYNKPSGDLTVDPPAQLTLNATPVDNHCYNGSSGSFTLSPGGGNGGYDYSFLRDGESTTRNNGQLPAGNYTITMTDSKSCSKTITGQPIAQPLSPLTLTATCSRHMSCPAVSNAEVTVTVNNFQANNTSTDISFWNGSNKLTIKSSNISGQNGTFVLSNLSESNSFAIIVKDLYCQANNSVAIPLKDPQFTIEPTTSQLAPCTGKYGIVTITPLDGEGTTYTYKIDGATKSSNINALKGNSIHSFLVTDGAGCTASYPNYKVVTKTDSVKLATVNPSDVDSAWCTSSNSGSLKVNTISNGVGTIRYKRIGESQSYPAQTSGIFTNLYPKKYTITASDDSLCSDIAEIVVPVRKDSLNINAINSIHAACQGNSPTGEIKVSRYTNGYKTGFGNVFFTLESISQQDTTFKNKVSGQYTITALDSKNCPSTANVEVAFDSNPVTFGIDSLKDQRCNEVQNAKLYLKAHTSKGSNQTFRFVYNGDTTAWHADSISYFVKTAGTYSFKVIDRNNCGTNLSHTIVNLHHAPKPTLHLSYSVACNKATDGYLSIYNTPNNSLPKYKYQLGIRTLYAGTSAQKVVFDGLPKGYHIITATDTLGCQDTARFVVDVRSDSIKISRIDTTSATCIAAQNGKAKIVASSFDKNVTTNKYTFLCNGNSLKGDSVIFSMLPVKNTGLYSVTVSDQYGCSDTKTFPVSVRKDTINLWQRLLVNAACPGSSDGNIKVRRINGNTSYKYQVTSAANGLIQNFYSNDTLVLVSGLPQGTYNISVKDTNNCAAAINNIPITQPQAIGFFNYSQNYIKHKGQPEGQMSASVQLGNRKYNYEWRNLSGNSIITSGKAVEFTNIQLSNQLAGNYMLRVRDTANCFVGSNGWLEKQFTIVEPQQDLTLAIKRMRRVSCFGLSDGEFQLKATGGWGNNYQYGFDALHLYADSVFSNRSIGTITMFAKDTSGVIVSLPVIITQPDLLTASLASKKDANCFGSADGSATASILGGNAPKYFVSSDNANWIPGNALTGLSQGNYTLYVRDSLNCHTNVPVTINQPTQIVRTNYQITNTRCGFDNGIITASINGGVPLYSYQWYKGITLLSSTTDSVSRLFSGSYRLSVTDAHNCTMSFPFNVSDITDLTIDTILTQPVTCWGYSDGSATAQLSKGNPPYIITWPDSTHLTSVSGLKTGTYSIWVTDQERCNVFKDFVIETPVNIYLSSKTVTNPLCEGVNDGALDVSANGSFSGFSYVWNNGSTKNSIKNLSPGNYTLTVTDNHNCSNHFDFSLNYQQYAKPNLGADLTLCRGNTFRLQPGLFSDYRWTSSYSFASRQPEVYVDQPGSYYVEVTDNYGCIGRDTIKISQSASELQAKLLLASSAEQNDTVVIFEASWPLPDSVKFQLNGCKVLSSGTYYREVIFPDTGTYVIGLTSYMNDCLDMVSKEIKVEPKSSSQLKSAPSKLIQLYTVSPNPNDGQFTTEVRLRESATILLHLANVSTGVITDFREYKGSDNYIIHYNLSNLASGTYVLHIQAGKETKTKILIIQK